jgi:hypothetical protein
MTAVALVALIGWLVGLQAVRVEHDRYLRPSRAVLITTTVLSAGAALLVVPALYLLVT